MPSIIDPATHRGGAGSVTRGLLKVLGTALSNAHIKVLPVPEAASPWSHGFRQCLSFARAFKGPVPAKPAFTYSRSLRDVVHSQLLEERYDLLILNGSDLLWLLHEAPYDLPVLLIAHNLEYSLYRSQIEHSGWPLRPFRSWLDDDCRRLESFELEGLRRARNVIFLSTADAELAHQSCPELNSLVAPPLFDEPRVPRALRALQAGRVQVLFLADFSWWPNLDGFRWFLDEVFSAAEHTMRLHVAGNRSEQFSPCHPNIVKHGFVTSTRGLWGLADIMICPIFGGGGIKVKLAHALYHRVPVLATSFAARGLPFALTDSIVLLDDGEKWVQFFRSGGAWELAARTVPLAVADRYSLETCVGSIRKYMLSVISGGAAGVAKTGSPGS
jgi:hypothetical protein